MRYRIEQDMRCNTRNIRRCDRGVRGLAIGPDDLAFVDDRVLHIENKLVGEEGRLEMHDIQVCVVQQALGQPVTSGRWAWSIWARNDLRHVDDKADTLFDRCCSESRCCL